MTSSVEVLITLGDFNLTGICPSQVGPSEQAGLTITGDKFISDCPRQVSVSSINPAAEAEIHGVSYEGRTLIETVKASQVSDCYFSQVYHVKGKGDGITPMSVGYTANYSTPWLKLNSDINSLKKTYAASQEEGSVSIPYSLELTLIEDVDGSLKDVYSLSHSDYPSPKMGHNISNTEYPYVSARLRGSLPGGVDNPSRVVLYVKESV